MKWVLSVHCILLCDAIWLTWNNLPFESAEASNKWHSGIPAWLFFLDFFFGGGGILGQSSISLCNTHWWLYTVIRILWRPLAVSIVDVTVIQFSKDNSNQFNRFLIDFLIILARLAQYERSVNDRKDKF